MNVIHFLVCKFFCEKRFGMRSFLPDLVFGDILGAIFPAGFFERFDDCMRILAGCFRGNGARCKSLEISCHVGKIDPVIRPEYRVRMCWHDYEGVELGVFVCSQVFEGIENNLTITCLRKKR